MWLFVVTLLVIIFAQSYVQRFMVVEIPGKYLDLEKIFQAGKVLESYQL